MSISQGGRRLFGPSELEEPAAGVTSTAVSRSSTASKPAAATTSPLHSLQRREDITALAEGHARSGLISGTARWPHLSQNRGHARSHAARAW